MADCVSVPTFFHFVDHLWLLSENSLFKNLGVINHLGWAVWQGTFYPHHEYEQINFLKKSSLYSFDWSLRNWKIAADLQLAKNWKILTKIWQNLLFYQHSQPLYNVRQKENKNLELVQGVNFELIDSLKNNGTKYLLIFDDSCENICNSKAFADNAIAGRHRCLSTIYIKDDFFHQSKLGRDVELQNTHIVLLKSVVK